VQNAARSWDTLWQGTKAVVEQLLPLLLTEDRARVQTDFESADATHAKVKDFLLSTAPSRQQLQDALEAVHRNNMLLVPFLFGLPLRLGNAIDRLDLEMKDRNRATDPEWVAWKGLAVRAVESLSTPGAKVADELRVLRENLKATIRSLAGRLEVEALASLREHLEKNEFVPAISLLKPRLQTSESVFRAAEAVRLRPIPPVMSEASAPGTPLSPRSAPVIPGEPELLAQIEQLETWKRVVIGILIVLFGWVVLGVSFKGEPLEYLTAFGWALLTDLTTANLITTFTPLKEKVKVP